MNGLRFKVGDVGVYALARNARYRMRIGTQCEIEDVGPFLPPHQLRNGAIATEKGDYAVIFQDGFSGILFDWQLRKIDSLEEPSSMTRTEECEVEA